MPNKYIATIYLSGKRRSYSEPIFPKEILWKNGLNRKVHRVIWETGLPSAWRRDVTEKIKKYKQRRIAPGLRPKDERKFGRVLEHGKTEDGEQINLTGGIFMRAARLAGVRKLEFADIPKPEPTPGKAVIKVAYGGICGSDVQIWADGEVFGQKLKIVLCHEFCGTVSDPGNVSGLKVGDRVVAMEITPCLECPTCRDGLLNSCPEVMKEAPGIFADGGWAEYATVRGDMLVKLPNEVDDLEAAMIEPASIGVHSLKQAKMQPGDKVLITGDGPIGIMAAATAKALGAGLVVMTGKVEKRLDFPRSQTYIDEVLCSSDPDLLAKLLQLTDQRGFDLALEATGTQPATDTAVQALKIGGKLAIVGTKGNITFNAPYLLSKAIKITGDMLFLPEDFATVIELMQTKKLDIKACATTVTTLDQIEKYLAEKETESGTDVKVLVKL